MKVARVGIFLTIVALIGGIVGCVGGDGNNGGESYTLTIDSTTGGKVTIDNVPIPGKAILTYGAGTLVSLSASQSTGYRFVEWTGNVSTIADINAASTTITMNDSYSITANFIAQYVLTIDSTDGGEVTTPGEGIFTYDAGTVVNLVAEAGEGYRFVKWTGGVDDIANVEDPTTTITINDNYSITANFEEKADGRRFFCGVLDPEGSWDYEWDYEENVYELVIDGIDRFITNSPKEEGQSWGGVSGGSSYSQAFVHIYHMNEQAGGDERRVIVAAWGDTHVFEAAVFPETQENVESVIKPATYKSMEEVIQHIQATIELSEDVIRGHTVDYHF